jgi:hypothetical protein
MSLIKKKKKIEKHSQECQISHSTLQKLVKLQEFELPTSKQGH